MQMTSTKSIKITCIAFPISLNGLRDLEIKRGEVLHDCYCYCYCWWCLDIINDVKY
jgi:hypothetical protein